MDVALAVVESDYLAFYAIILERRFPWYKISIHFGETNNEEIDWKVFNLQTHVLKFLFSIFESEVKSFCGNVKSIKI